VSFRPPIILACVLTFLAANWFSWANWGNGRWYLDAFGLPSTGAISRHWDLRKSHTIADVGWPPAQTGDFWSVEGNPSGINLDLLLPDGHEAKFSGSETHLNAGGFRVRDITFYFNAEDRSAAYNRASQLLRDWGIDDPKPLSVWWNHVHEMSLRAVADGEYGNCYMTQRIGPDTFPRYKVSIRRAGEPKTTYVVIWQVTLSE